MQGIYTYIPETDYVPRQYSVAAILLFLFTVHLTIFAASNVLYFYISTFRNTCAVSNMAVFCNFFISCFPNMFYRRFLNDLEMVAVVLLSSPSSSSSSSNIIARDKILSVLNCKLFGIS